MNTLRLKQFLKRILWPTKKTLLKSPYDEDKTTTLEYSVVSAPDYLILTLTVANVVLTLWRDRHTEEIKVETSSAERHTPATKLYISHQIRIARGMSYIRMDRGGRGESTVMVVYGKSNDSPVTVYLCDMENGVVVTPTIQEDTPVPDFDVPPSGFFS